LRIGALSRLGKVLTDGRGHCSPLALPQSADERSVRLASAPGLASFGPREPIEGDTSLVVLFRPWFRFGVLGCCCPPPLGVFHLAWRLDRIIKRVPKLADLKDVYLFPSGGPR
jgi:hypothetical protein